MGNVYFQLSQRKMKLIKCPVLLLYEQHTADELSHRDGAGEEITVTTS
jgi:hypothetical protein